MVAHTKHSHEGKIRCKCRRQLAVLNKPVSEQHGTLSNLSQFYHNTEKLIVLIIPEQKETNEKKKNKKKTREV